MNKLMAAVALAIALPGVAHAQAAPAEKPKMECCDKMKDKWVALPGASASSGAPSERVRRREGVHAGARRHLLCRKHGR